MAIGKPYHKNPRQISRKQHKRLKGTLMEYGDLSGVIHNLETDEIIGGNQRDSIFDEGIVRIVEQFDEPDEQGTVGLGFIIWEGFPYFYRQVRWDEKTAEKANLEANSGGGDWDFEIFANLWDSDILEEAGFDEDRLKDWQQNTFALGDLLASENGNWGDAFGNLPSEDRAPFQQMTFTLHDTQVEIVKGAIANAKNNDFTDSPNENSNGNALSFICQEFGNGDG